MDRVCGPGGRPLQLSKVETETEGDSKRHEVNFARKTRGQRRGQCAHVQIAKAGCPGSEPRWGGNPEPVSTDVAL